MLATPVLFLIFNRPENTAQVFDAIRKAQPKHLFIAADGPRGHVEGEAEKCEAARSVLSQIDWDCEVKPLFRENNLGCKQAVSSGITWFFEHVEEGIILEDDCVPDPSFFSFCETLLSYYRNDKRIMMVCGTNYLSDEINNTIQESYFFSNYYPIWGWATWKRAWSSYDVDMQAWDNFKDKKQLNWLFPNSQITDYYCGMFDMLKNGFNTWDIQWWFTCIFQNGLSIVPRSNLVTNIGVVGTHSDTQGDFFIKRRTISIDASHLKHPKYIFPDRYLNEMTYLMSHAQLDLSTTPAASLSPQQIDRIVDSVPRSYLINSLKKRLKSKLKIG